MLSKSPLCKRLSKYPAASRASAESGGVLISTCSHASGLSVKFIDETYVISDILTSNGAKRRGQSPHNRGSRRQKSAHIDSNGRNGG